MWCLRPSLRLADFFTNFVLVRKWSVTDHWLYCLVNNSSSYLSNFTYPITPYGVCLGSPSKEIVTVVGKKWSFHLREKNDTRKLHISLFTFYYDFLSFPHRTSRWIVFCNFLRWFCCSRQSFPSRQIYRVVGAEKIHSLRTGPIQPASKVCWIPSW